MGETLKNLNLRTNLYSKKNSCSKTHEYGVQDPCVTYSYYVPVDLNFILRQAGALSLDHSGVVDIIQCNFSNNKIALNGYSDYNYRHIQLVINIEESIFTNNTSLFEGSAVHFQTITRKHASISVNQSVFIDNTAS